MKKTKSISTVLIAGALIFSSSIPALASRCNYGPSKWNFDRVILSEKCTDKTHGSNCKIETLRWTYFSECEYCGNKVEIDDKIIVWHTGEK